MKQLEEELQSDEEQLNRLHQAKERINNLTKVGMKLSEYCKRVKQNLAQLAFQEKRSVLDALDIKVMATQENIEIKAVIPIELIDKKSTEKFSPIAQTWGCLHGLKMYFTFRYIDK
ncbi:MAG: hypothetical protein JSV74_01595 [Dehalococcoidia bacterium]|nr:MAG: hypothetical protein JSV74_01595 [Dehalococcoidia bacterium]